MIHGLFLPHRPRWKGQGILAWPCPCPIEVAYNIVQQASTDPDLTCTGVRSVLEPIWAQGSLATTDSLDLVFPSDEEFLRH
jgi:hypothetical protein